MPFTARSPFGRRRAWRVRSPPICVAMMAGGCGGGGGWLWLVVVGDWWWWWWLVVAVRCWWLSWCLSSRFVLSPNHSKVVRWNMVILIAMFYVSTVTPYEVRVRNLSPPLDGLASGLSFWLASRRQEIRESPSSPPPPAGPRRREPTHAHTGLGHDRRRERGAEHDQLRGRRRFRVRHAPPILCWLLGSVAQGHVLRPRGHRAALRVVVAPDGRRLDLSVRCAIDRSIDRSGARDAWRTRREGVGRPHTRNELTEHPPAHTHTTRDR